MITSLCLSVPVRKQLREPISGDKSCQRALLSSKCGNWPQHKTEATRVMLYLLLPLYCKRCSSTQSDLIQLALQEVVPPCPGR